MRSCWPTVDGVEDWLETMNGAVLVRGHARFIDPHTIDVDGRTAASRSHFPQCRWPGRGSRVSGPGRYRLSDEASESWIWIMSPGIWSIVGGSYIALEFAQMYRALRGAGDGDREGPATDLAAKTRTSRPPSPRSCEAEGHRRGAQRRPASGSSSARTVSRSTPRDGAGPDRGHAPACSRWDGCPTPTTSAWRTPAWTSTDVATSWWTISCAPPSEHIWAMGDCNGKGAFTHTSYNDFEIVAANLLDDDPRRVERPRPHLRALHRPTAGAGRHDRRSGAPDPAEKRWWASVR